MIQRGTQLLSKRSRPASPTRHHTRLSVGVKRNRVPDSTLPVLRPSTLRDTFPIGIGDQTARATLRGERGRAALLHEARPALGSCSTLSGRRKCTDRNVISVRISE